MSNVKVQMSNEIQMSNFEVQKPKISDSRWKATYNNSKFVTPAPYPVRGKLRRESSDLKSL